MTSWPAFRGLTHAIIQYQGLEWITLCYQRGTFDTRRAWTDVVHAVPCSGPITCFKCVAFYTHDRRVYSGGNA